MDIKTNLASMIPEFRSPPKQPRVYKGIKPLIEADILARHCSKLTRKEQLRVRKDGSIYDRVLDTVQIPVKIELKIFLFPR